MIRWDVANCSIAPNQVTTLSVDHIGFESLLSFERVKAPPRCRFSRFLRLDIFELHALLCCSSGLFQRSRRGEIRLELVRQILLSLGGGCRVFLALLRRAPFELALLSAILGEWVVPLVSPALLWRTRPLGAPAVVPVIVVVESRPLSRCFTVF